MLGSPKRDVEKEILDLVSRLLRSIFLHINIRSQDEKVMRLANNLEGEPIFPRAGFVVSLKID